MAPGAAWPLYLSCICLVRYTLLLVLLLTFTTCHSDNKHDLQQNTALAIVRTSAQRETPLALKLSAIVIVESERTPTLFFWDPPTGLPSLPFRVYPITTQMQCSCQFLPCRFKNFSPETLVMFLLCLFSHQITLYAFITFLCLA